MLALVLGGGNALGAYHGGVVSAMEAAGVQPDWLAGSSIGAVMAALVAGNPPGRRTAAVREFWRRGASLAPRPRRLGDAAERQSDLLFACQTERTLRAVQQAWRLHAGAAPAAVYRMTYASQPGETAMKGFDFSQSSLDRRWQQGEQDMRNALRMWRDTPPQGGALTIHDAVAAPAMAAA